MPLNPQCRVLLDLVAAADRPLERMTVAEARAEYRGRRDVVQPPPPEVAETTDFDLPTGGPGQASIAARYYRPAGAFPNDVLPVLLYLHGGGWTIGDLDTHDTLCRSLANGAACAVLSLDYRMGPEHRFPAAVDDALAAFDWLVEHAQRLFVDPSRIAVGGDSAGGNLAAVLSLLCRDRQRQLDKGPERDRQSAVATPAYQLLIYPATDMRLGQDSHRRNGEGFLLTSRLIEWFRGHYIDDPRHYEDWRASPLLVGDFGGLPPALVLTAGYDPLVDEGRAYADCLEAAGVAVQRVEYPGQIHGFITMGRMLDDAGTAIAQCAAALNAAFAGGRR